ncbi:MAG: Hpt domain-containing protein [Spirochaetia bacterium]|nr:Hpt domain-containing protein [Spirochaetia bacterium]
MNIGALFGFRELDTIEARLQGPAQHIYQENLDHHRRGLDHIMSFVLIFNWILAILFAVIVSPKTWIGAQSLVNFHVKLAIVQGGFMSLFPTYLAWFHPGKPMTRHVIAMSQCLFASLLVHLTGGRIETHFYYFGSLAFLAFYRDWKVVVTGTIFVAADHLLRGIFWPLSVFGSVSGNDWRWLEHASWVVVMDIVLFLGIIIAEREVREISEKRATVDDYSQNMEDLVHKRTEQLVVAKKETDTILNSMDEGLFVLHRSNGGYIVGEQQSAAIERIFKTPRLPSEDFGGLASRYFSKDTADAVQNYLTMLTRSNITDKMIRDLNPLELAQARVGEGVSTGDSRHLKFNFKKIENAADFLVSVQDVTEQVELERQLKENEKKAEEQTQMLLSILHVGPRLLEDFMEGVNIEMAILQNALRNQNDPSALRNTIDVIFRAAHSIKGNAGLVELKLLAQAAHEFEEKVDSLRYSEHLTWDDFVPVAFEFARLESVYQHLKDLIGRIQSFQQASGGDSQSAIQLIPASANQLLLRLAEETGIKVRMNSEGFNGVDIPNKYAYILRDIVAQLVRNSVAHGIETPEDRIRAGKPESGTVEMDTKILPEYFHLRYRDDGRSFNFGAIRERAARLGYGTETETQTWDNAKLVRLVFEPGFSTVKETSMHAGRGMGMDIVRQRVRTVGGEVRLNYRPGKFLEFNFSFPLTRGFSAEKDQTT